MQRSKAYNKCVVMVAALAAVSGTCKRSTSSSGVGADQTSTVEQEGDSPMRLVIQSPAFGHNEAMPQRFTGDGADMSPALTWSDLPAGTKELALICDDPDAPRPQPWVHWVIYKVPASATGLPENVAKTDMPSAPVGVLQGKNSWGRIGYGGPAPPPGSGMHHYHFKLYALDTMLNAGPGLD
ncbi:MAG: YbhB/YbcL family Raf kinase inhibitor-like protein, partial [Planctomycetota bacterium]